MKIEKLTIHNFRSVKHQSINLDDYSLLVGANNSGKTNIIDAIRVFYEKDIKFNKSKDFPKFSTADAESWIEITYKLNTDEFKNLRDEYKSEVNRLRVRKYLFSEQYPDKVKANQSNIYAYEKAEVLSRNLFYGAKAVSEGKLGDVLFIPEITRADEYTKMSGPSVLRNILEFVVKKVIKKSESYESLSSAFEEFNERFQKESDAEGYSIRKLRDEINMEIQDWGTSFGLEINQIKPEEIIKNLVRHYLIDKNMPNQELDLSVFGQGLQRHLIYVFIKLSAKYKEGPSPKERKEFSPDFNLILFEEPEAFLHPSQQEVLNSSLKEITQRESEQVLISTHSSHFVSKNADDIPNIIKLRKKEAETIIHQLSKLDLDHLLQENKELKSILGIKPTGKEFDVESFWYSLWLDPDRCCSFFADLVLICEGASEKVLLDLLIKEKKINLENKKLYILSSAGKENIHRYMNLFHKLGISHSVLFDGDNNAERHRKINEFLHKNKNEFTRRIHQFVGDFEDFLEIEKGQNGRNKPLSVLWHYKHNKIKNEKIEELAKIIIDIVS